MKKDDRKLPLSQQIRLRREELGLSLGEVARRAERINISSLSRIESGSEPSVATLQLLTGPLDCEFHIDGSVYLVPSTKP